jgi:hypothetical protein
MDFKYSLVGVCDMILCKDCKYSKKWGWLDGWIPLIMWKCKHPQSEIIDKINGKYEYRFCETMRGTSFPCGNHGLLFEERSN